MSETITTLREKFDVTESDLLELRGDNLALSKYILELEYLVIQANRGSRTPSPREEPESKKIADAKTEQGLVKRLREIVELAENPNNRRQIEEHLRYAKSFYSSASANGPSRMLELMDFGNYSAVAKWADSEADDWDD